MSQNDTPKPTPSQPTKMSFKTVLERIITPPSKTTGQPKRLDHPINLEQSEKTESSDNTGKLGLSVSLGVLATIVLCLFGFGVYKWYWSSHSSIVASRVDEGETIEIRDPSGTTIQESSFMARPSRRYGHIQIYNFVRSSNSQFFSLHMLFERNVYKHCLPANEYTKGKQPFFARLT